MKSFFTLCLFVAIGYSCHQTSNLFQNSDALFVKTAVAAVQEYHLQPKTIDNQLSKEVFDFYLQEIDPKKEFLTQKDVEALKIHENQIDEALTNGTFDFLSQALEVLQKRIQKAEKYSLNILENRNWDFTIEEQMETNAEKLAYAVNEGELEERWRKKVKLWILEELWKLEQQSPNFSLEEQKNSAVSRVKDLTIKKFERWKKVSKEEQLEEYLSAYLKVHDVQTEYLSKAQKKKWTEDFTRKLVGIGANIEIIKDYPQITGLTIGGPAWKSQKVEEGDVILKIGEGNQTPVDALGMSIEEVIALLRGEKDTQVRLTLQKKNRQIEKVRIVRGEISFDTAMAFVLEGEQVDKKVGYIRLPRFYGGEDACATHVLQHIEALKKEDIEGIVFDVRNNKGGASRQAIEIMGYFLEGGTVMQSNYRNGNQRFYEDEDTEAQYKGELLILTNSRSGSASELFAGTMQDYGRAVIVGGKATFGKGSIQRFVELEETAAKGVQSFGEIKMTVGNFFTASGRSPQYTGIQSDIILPDNDAFVKSGERVYKYAFPPTNLERTTVSQSVTSPIDLQKLQALSLQRLTDNKRLQWAKRKAQHIKTQQENTIVELNYELFKHQKENSWDFEMTFKELFGEIEGFRVSVLPPMSDDSTTVARSQRWIETLQRDPYVYECFRIMGDWLG